MRVTLNLGELDLARVARIRASLGTVGDAMPVDTIIKAALAAYVAEHCAEPLAGCGPVGPGVDEAKLDALCRTLAREGADVR